MSSFFYAKIYSLLARRRSSQPVQRVYWPENVIDWPEQWRTACVMLYARGHKLQSFRRKLPFCMDHYSVVSTNKHLKLDIQKLLDEKVEKSKISGFISLNIYSLSWQFLDIFEWPNCLRWLHVNELIKFVERKRENFAHLLNISLNIYM